MKPKHNWLWRRQRVKALWSDSILAAVALLGLASAVADTTNFTGEFAPSWWAATPQYGAIYFTNSNSELVLAGPSQPASDTSSVEPIGYNGPLPGGLTVGGTVEFDWQYNSPYGLNDAAYFAWTPQGGSSSQVLLAQGAGATNSIFSIQLDQGATFQFVLLTDVPANKFPGSLAVTNFQFHANVPEPSSTALFGGAMVLLGSVRWWRSRRSVLRQR
jgi:hypothetical protein